jgi:hypothetical protein
MAKEAIEDLQRRRGLMAEIVELGKEMPDEDTMANLAAYVQNRRALAELPEPPDEDEMETVKAGVAVIKEIDALRSKHPDDL